MNKRQIIENEIKGRNGKSKSVNKRSSAAAASQRSTARTQPQARPENDNLNAVSTALRDERKKLRKEAGAGNLVGENIGDALSWLKAGYDAAQWLNPVNAALELAGGYKSARDDGNSVGDSIADAVTGLRGRMDATRVQSHTAAEQSRTSERHKRTDEYQQRRRSIQQEYDQRLIEEENMRQERAAAKYENVAARSDFARKAAEGKAKTGAQNGGEASRGQIARAIVETAASLDPTGTVTPLRQFMDEREQSVYDYYLAAEGRQKAEDYLKTIRPRLEKRRADQQSIDIKEYAQENPVAASLYSVGTNLGQAGSLLGTAGTAAENLFRDVKKPVNTSSALFAPSRATEALRGGAKENINSSLGNFLYDTGMSMADNAVQMAMFPQALFGEKAMLSVMSSSAAGAAAYDAAQRGLTAGDALLIGSINGLAEYVTEIVPIENLFKLAKGGTKFISRDMVREVLKQSGVEATEELISSYTDTLADIAIAGNNSQYSRYIEDMVAQGMSREQAENEAIKQFFVVQPLEDAAGGALSGAVMGGGAIAKGDIVTRAYGNTLDAGSVAQMARATGDAGLAQQAADLDNGGGTWERGNLAMQTNEFMDKLDPQQQTAVQLRYAQATGQQLTQGQSAALRYLTGEQLPQSELISLRDGSIAERTQFEQLTGFDLGAADISTLTAQATVNEAANEQNAQIAEQGAALLAQNDAAQAQAAQEQAVQLEQAQQLRQAAAVQTAMQQQAAAAQPQTVRVGKNADFSSADISDKRKALLTKASSALNKLGVSADIDASGDIRAQAGSAVYNAVKGTAVNKALREYLGSSFSAETAAKTVGRIIDGDLRGTAVAKAVTTAVNRGKGSGGKVKFMSSKSTNADYSDYDAPITESDIQTLRSIGRKSINEFTSEDIQKSQKWANKFWQQLGTKSPFFRAWFGDWRAHDTSTITIVKEADATRGSAINSDTGWEINISGKVFGETQSHNSTRSNKAKAFLPFIRSIVDHAVLLDTTVISEKDKKSDNSLYMHSFYAIADIGNGDELIKLFVEEMNDPNSSNTNKRAYKLNYIENVGKASVRVQSNTPSSLTNTLPTDYTVSDLYDLVKRYDKEFKPHEANPEFLNDNGTPKQYYHGTPNGTFTEFKDWQYFTDSSDYADVYQAQGASSNGYKRTADNPKTYAVYLKADNIFDTRNEAEREIFESEFFGQWGNGAPLSEKGLPDWTDGDDLIEFFEENGYDYDAILLDEGAVGGYGEDVVSRGVSVVIRDSSQIKSADDNIGTFDKESRDIRYLSEKASAKSSSAKAPVLSEAVKRSKKGTIRLDTNRGRLSAVEVDIAKYTAGNELLAKEAENVQRLASRRAQTVKWIAGNSTTRDGESYTITSGFWYQGVVYLNAESIKNAYTRVFGHELGHDVLSRNKDSLQQYYDLRRAWAERNGTTAELEARINNIINERDFDTSDPNAVFEELMCDDLGDYMTDEQFARFAVAENRSLWQRIAYSIAHLAERVRAIFGGNSSQYREANQLRAFMLDMLNSDAGTALPSAIRGDAARAVRTADSVRGRYQPREYRESQQTKWTQPTGTSDDAFKGVTTKRANESTAYGYQTIRSGGDTLKVYVVNPASGKLDAQHKANLEAARKLAAATGMRIAFTTGNAINVDRKTGEALTRTYDVLQSGGVWYVNTQSTDPYTAVLGARWYEMYAAANPARGRTLARMVARVNRLTGQSETAGGTAARQITSGEYSSYVNTPRAIMSAEALKMSPAMILDTFSGDRTVARSLAQENPSLIRRAADVAGDMLARLSGTKEQRAQKIMRQVEANLLYALSDTAANSTTEEGEKIPAAKKRRAVPEGMRLMSVVSNIVDDNDKDYGRGVLLDTNIFKGYKPREWGKPLMNFVRNNLAGRSIEVTNADGSKETISFAAANERVQKDGSNNSHKVIDKLGRKTDRNSQLAVAHADEIIQVAEAPQSNNDNSHQWLDANGWTHKTATLISRDGRIYEATLNIAHTQDGRSILYDINKIHEVGHGAVSSIAESKRDSHIYPDFTGASQAHDTNNGPVQNVRNAQVAAPDNTISEAEQYVKPNSGGDIRFSATRNDDTQLRRPTRTENRAYLDDYVSRYGTIPEGENVNSRGDQNVPARTSDDTRTRQTVRTYLEALTTTDATAGELEYEISNGTFAYEPIANKAANAYASEVLSQGIDEARAKWNAVTRSSSTPGKKDIVLGERLILDAMSRGDVSEATRMIAEVAAEATRAGQIVQAISMVKRLSPAGQLLTIQRQVNSLNQQLAGKGKQITVGEEQMRQFNEAAQQLEEARQKIVELEEQLRRGVQKNDGGYIEDQLADSREQESQAQQALDDAKNAIIQDVAAQVPSTWLDKFNAWRYLAMLGNPRTHIRNIVGNAAFIPAVRIKQAIAGTLERAFVRSGERTQSVRPAPRSLREFAAKDAQQQLEWLKSGGKYNATDQIEEERKIFSESNLFGKALNKLSDLNSWALDAEDGVFLKMHYQRALAGYAVANGLSAYQLENDPALLDKARAVAAREAQKATYRDMNALSDFMSKASRELKAKRGAAGKAAYAIFEGVLPFKKTPMNIVKRSLEYSPVGVFTALSNGVRKLTDSRTGRANDYTATDFIDDLSAGMTGTMIVALGAFLSSLGMLRGRNKDKEDDFEKLQGAQEWSFVWGDKSYTIDWMAPTSLPLFVGAELWEQTHTTNQDLSLTALLDALTQITEPIFNLSMLDGIQSVLQSYSSEGVISEMLGNALESFAGQMFPTLGGQLARTIDDKTRNAYYNEEKATGKWNGGMQVVRSAMSKIPGVEKKLPEKIDAWGRNAGEGQSTAERALENFVSPGYFSKSKTTDVDRELKKIFDETGDDTIFPQTAAHSFTYNKETYYMDAGEYVDFAKTQGQTAYSMLDQMRQSQKWKSASTEQKINWIKKTYEYSKVLAKSKTGSGFTFDSSSAKWHKKAYDSKNPAQYIMNMK